MVRNWSMLSKGCEKLPCCPKCECEYREGFTVCADCGEELVDDWLPDKKNEIDIKSQWVLFFQTNDVREAEIIESILKTSDIPFLIKDRGAGGYLKVYMGMTNMGMDIYVPDSRLNDARELIPPTETIFEDIEEKKIVAKSNKRSTYIDNRQKSRANILILFLVVVPFVMWLITVLSELLE